MKCTGIVLCTVALCFAQQSTIDINQYTTSKKHKVTERVYTIGNHTFKVLNIKPLQPGPDADTACISAIVLDKRKYVLFDVDVAAGGVGLIVPPMQPVGDGLIILKASPYEGKTFLLLSNGKVVTLPGASVIVDSVGNCLYCVWDNNKTFRLTVFDYKNLRVVIKTTEIDEPKEWFTNGVAYGFTGSEPKTFYTIDFMMRNIVKSDKPDSDMKPVPYLVDIDKLDRSKCCGPDVMKK